MADSRAKFLTAAKNINRLFYLSRAWDYIIVFSLNDANYCFFRSISFNTTQINRYKQWPLREGAGDVLFDRHWGHTHTLGNTYTVAYYAPLNFGRLLAIFDRLPRLLSPEKTTETPLLSWIPQGTLRVESWHHSRFPHTWEDTCLFQFTCRLFASRAAFIKPSQTAQSLVNFIRRRILQKNKFTEKRKDLLFTHSLRTHSKFRACGIDHVWSYTSRWGHTQQYISNERMVADKRFRGYELWRKKAVFSWRIADQKLWTERRKRVFRINSSSASPSQTPSLKIAEK